jgi:hypothetical protein
MGEIKREEVIICAIVGEKRDSMSKKHGELIAALGMELSGSHELVKNDYMLIYDHGKGSADDVGVTSAWIGGEKQRDNRLAEIDIVVYEAQSNKARLLIEIEESGDNPKKILGDAMAVLFGEKISMSGGDEFRTGGFTTLLILARGEGDAHIERTRLIEERINTLFRTEGMITMKIGAVQLVLFRHEDDLKPMIIDMLRSRS